MDHFCPPQHVNDNEPLRGATAAAGWCHRSTALNALVFLLFVALMAKMEESRRSSSSCALSLRESSGFFCEPDGVWKGRAARFIEQQRQQMVSVESDLAFVFFQKNWEPNFSCIRSTRLGPPGDGGKWVCDPHTIRAMYAGPAAGLKRSSCIVYSVGSNDVYDFEVAVHQTLPDCDVHVFDFTVASPHPPPYVTYHSMGLGASDVGVFSRLESIIYQLGHDDDFIEVLKIDCEGCEYEAVFPVLPLLRNVRQLLLEVHSSVPPTAFHEFFLAMSDAGWVVTSKEPNTQYGRGSGVEYAFLKLAWDTKALRQEIGKRWCVGGWTGTTDPAAYVRENTALCKEWGALAPDAPLPLPHPIV